MVRLQDSLTSYWQKLIYWFNSGGDYHHFNSNRFFMNILYLIAAIIVTMIFYSNLSFFNEYELLFFKIGSVLLLIGLFFILKYIYYIFKQLKKGHSNLINGHKAILAILLILALLFVYLHQETYIPKIKDITNKFSISDLNPITLEFGNQTSKYIIQKEIIPAVFTSFLPQPWGFLAFWAAVVIVMLLLMRRFVFEGEIPDWLIWILVVVAIIMVFQFKIPYDTVKMNDYNLYCGAEGQVLIKDNLFGLGTLTSQLGASVSCLDYKSSQCRPLCQNSVPVCQCEANLVDIVFHQKGDWIFGGG